MPAYPLGPIRPTAPSRAVPAWAQTPPATPAEVAPPAVTNIWGELVYRKVRDQPFVIPVDHLVGPNATTARQRLIKNYRRFARGRVRRSPAFWRIGPAIEPADNHYLGGWIFAVLGRLTGTHGRKIDGRR